MRNDRLDEDEVDMEFAVEREDQVDSWQETMLVYHAALKQINTKLEILNDEFQHVHRYNPIEHIKSRIKTSESIVKKLKRYGYESTIENMVKYVNDIAGIRVICSFIDDIYIMSKLLADQDDITVLRIKDYIQNPKDNGYRSYHMIVEIPVFFAEGKTPMRAEIQIRTIAMDFWASLEHQLRYKKDLGSSEEYKLISRELYDCACTITAVDKQMQNIKNLIEEYSELTLR